MKISSNGSKRKSANTSRSTRAKRAPPVRIAVESADRFFARARAQARKLDRGVALPAAVRLSFEDPADLLDVLTPARLRLMRTVEAKAVALSVLTKALARDPSAVRRDVAVLEHNQLLRTRRIGNPGHGVQTIVERAAVFIELSAVI